MKKKIRTDGQRLEEEMFRVFGMTCYEKNAENTALFYADEIKLYKEGKRHLVDKASLRQLYRYKLIKRVQRPRSKSQR